METRDPYAEALDLIDAGKLSKALDLLHWAGRALDPLAYDEAWAEVEVERGQYGAAAGRAERTIAAGRATPRLFDIAAIGKWHLGLREEARAHAERAGDATPRAAFTHARIAYGYGELDETERLAGRASELSPEWIAPQAYVLAARALRGERDARVGLRLLWERTRDPWALKMLFDLVGRGDPLGLDEELIRHLEAEPRDAYLLGQILWLRLRRREWDDAIRVFDASPEAAQESAYNLRQRGLASRGKGRHGNSLPFLERAHALDPLDEWTIDALFRAFLLTGRWRRAVGLLKERERARKAAGIEEESMGDFLRNLRWREGTARRRGSR